MDKIIHIQAQYSRECSLHVCKKAFHNRQKLHGHDLFTLTPIKQVNYFVIKQLFRTWQHEILQLQSPYFDYTHPEIRKNLIQFMNLLSKHIAIHEKDLEPLLATAIDETLLLIRQPRDFYHKELVLSVQTLSVKYLRNTQKYVRIHTDFLKAFAQVFQQLHTPEIDQAQAQQLFDKAAEHTSFDTEDPMPYLLSIHNIHPLPPDLAPQQVPSKVPPPAPSRLSAARQEQLIRHLFKGQKTPFQLALKEIHACSSFDHAKDILLNKYGKPRQWNSQDQHLQAWLDNLQQQFPA